MRDKNEKFLLYIGQTSLIGELFADLKAAGYRAGLSESLEEALRFIKNRDPVLVLAQDQFNMFRAEELLKAVLRISISPKVVVFSKSGTAQDAKRFMELGAHDYWLCPLLWNKVQILLKGLENTGERTSRQGTSRGVERPIIGQDPLIKRTLALAKKVAPSKASVLISGPSGTGKELFARYIHGHSERSSGPFVAVNCAALPEHLLESELFGHEKGAFTGAIQRKPGKFELAHQGTILLDEVSEMDLALQAKLLRVLQEGEVDRIGGLESIRVDVRIVATTNRNLEKEVKEGRFREDLYYRLNVIPLRLPSLKERKTDILFLANYFIEQYCRVYDLPVKDLSDQARKWLEGYSWPGNVRELQNMIERAVLVASGPLLEPRHFLLELSEQDLAGEVGQDTSSLDRQEIQAVRYQKQGKWRDQEVLPLQEMEKRLILKSLDKTGGNRTRAAELLGISVRTLRNKLNEYRKQGIVV